MPSEARPKNGKIRQGPKMLNFRAQNLGSRGDWAPPPPPHPCLWQYGSVYCVYFRLEPISNFNAKNTLADAHE